LGSVYAYAQNEEIIYSTGFESAQGFTAGTSYNNIVEKIDGPAGQQWGTYYGTASTTSAIAGAQSMQMRWYTTAVDNKGYTYTNFDLANVTKVTFKAANTLGLNVIVSYSTNGGADYVGAQTFTLTGSSADYEYVVSATGAIPAVRLKFAITYDAAPTGTARLYLDDVVVYGMVSGIPTVATPTFSAAGIAKSTDTYFNSADVTISSITQDAAVYYTTNGTTPTTASTLFTAPVNITSTTTFKAMAVKDGMDNSAVAEKTINIVLPATATVPYTESFNNTLGDWYAVEVAGSKPFVPSADGAYMNGFGGGNVESWLISPKFTSTQSALAIAFNYASKYVGNPLLVKFSADYAGFGNPASATWTTLKVIAAPETQDDNYTVKSSGDIVIATTGTVYFALVYAATANYSDWRITNASVNVSTAPPTPTITVTEMSVPAMNADVGGFAAVDITVNGVNLTGNITVSISGANADYFMASPPVIAAESGMVLNAGVSITYTPLAAGSHTATLTLSSPGADNVTRTLNGTAIIPPQQLTPPNVIISEVYGGGGNSGAPFNADFVELYNTTNSQIEVGGWSVQYYSATGTNANVIAIPGGKIIPGKGYFLISAAGGSVGSNLPTPDVSSTSPNISATNGKVALYTVIEGQALTEPLTIEQIVTNVAFKDYVAFGTAQPQWGSALAAPSNSTSATRKIVSGNYSYTQQLGYDFVIMTPSPQNSGLSSVPKLEAGRKLTAINGTLRFNATAGELVEVYNVIGQKVISSIANDGLNTIPVPAKGMMVVKIGNQTAKVIL
ncbi:MAG: chitobiase/beta-hexosaminidase C-terminal domain-containing protein, partial [Paludibacter sp.]|nr:chitobiase/beta-hexosaminidase C-terminal domain-containing protein [Paludibacter sp.]